MKLIATIILSLMLLFSFGLIVKSESETINVKGNAVKVDNVYTFTISKTFTASNVVIRYANITQTFTSTGFLVDVNLIVTSTTELEFAGDATTITMIETDDPENPFIIFSSVEDLRFVWNKQYYSNFLPMIYTSKT